MPGFAVIPANMIYVIKKHSTPGKWTIKDEQYPCYTSTELIQIAHDVKLNLDEILPVSYQEVFDGQDGSKEEVVELEHCLRKDNILKELSAFHLVLGRKQAM